MPPFVAKTSPSKKSRFFKEFVRILQDPESGLVNDLASTRVGRPESLPTIQGEQPHTHAGAVVRRAPDP